MKYNTIYIYIYIYNIYIYIIYIYILFYYYYYYYCSYCNYHRLFTKEGKQKKKLGKFPILLQLKIAYIVCHFLAKCFTASESYDVSRRRVVDQFLWATVYAPFSGG